jgi:hypothetical protein
MDGGEYSRAFSKEDVRKNMTGAMEVIQEADRIWHFSRRSIPTP